MRRVAWPMHLLICLLVNQSASADSIPYRSAQDPRVRYVDYKPDEVFTIATALGVVTRIVLGTDEVISKIPDSGFPGGCEEPSNEWCIRADVGSNQITIKPRRGATRNNLEVSTNKRDYSFSLIKMDGAERAKAVFYRVLFRYPMPPLPAVYVQLPDAQPPAKPAKPAEPAADTKRRIAYAPHTLRNVHYSFKSDEDSADILPTVVFDDGRFTYLKFPKAREIPAVFAADAKGEEVRVSMHAERLLADPTHPEDKAENDYLVIHRVVKKLILRLDTLVAEIINDKYDPDGIETINGSTLPTLKREDK